LGPWPVKAGDIPLFARPARETTVLHDLIQDARLAVRTSRARPTFTLLAVLTISLAIGATTVVFGVLRGVVMRALPYHEPDRLAQNTELAHGSVT
jgi:putative ABC transport system permease protein